VRPATEFVTCTLGGMRHAVGISGGRELVRGCQRGKRIDRWGRQPASKAATAVSESDPDLGAGERGP
jgi:hypothetical protein